MIGIGLPCASTSLICSDAWIYDTYDILAELEAELIAVCGNQKRPDHAYAVMGIIRTV